MEYTLATLGEYLPPAIHMCCTIAVNWQIYKWLRTNNVTSYKCS